MLKKKYFSISIYIPYVNQRVQHSFIKSYQDTIIAHIEVNFFLKKKKRIMTQGENEIKGVNSP